MEDFMIGYSKIFCDEKGQYFKPEIKKSLNQNYLSNENVKPNPNENKYQNSSMYNEFLE